MGHEPQQERTGAHNVRQLPMRAMTLPKKGTLVASSCTQTGRQRGLVHLKAATNQS
jgi:hypothetical protein